MKRSTYIIIVLYIVIVILTARLMIAGQAEPITKEVEKVVEVVPDGYIDMTAKDFQAAYIDIQAVNSYSGTDNGLQLNTDDGNGYYLDIKEESKEQADTLQVYYIRSETDLDTFLDALETRNGKIIIEVITGTVDDAEGNGTDINGYYVKYDNTRFLEGDKVQSVFIYNPDNNSTDDILYRVDTLIE